MNTQRIKQGALRFCKISLLGVVIAQPFSKALVEVFISASFIGWLFFKILKKESICNDRLLLGLLCLFLVSSSVSVFSSGYPVTALRGVLKLLKYLTLLLLVAEVARDPIWFRRLIIVGVAVFCTILFDAYFQGIYKIDFIRHFPAQATDTQTRLSGPFNTYGLLAAYLIAILPVLIAFLTFNKGPLSVKSFLFTGITFAALYILYKTHSRGAWLSFFGSLCCLTYFLRSRLLAILLLIGVISVPFVFPKNTLIHLDKQGKEQSLIERYQLWNRAIQVIVAKPLFGCGINTYVRNYPKFDRARNWRVPGYYAHNGYLQLAAETGLISLALFLLILGIALKAGWQAFKNETGGQKALVAGFLTGCIALLSQAAVDTTLHNLQSAVLIWFYLGLLLAFGNRGTP